MSVDDLRFEAQLETGYSITVTADTITSIKIIQPGNYCEIEAVGFKAWLPYTKELEAELERVGLME